MISVALVDFGDTLADQTFMRKDSERFPTWTTDYVAVLSEMQEEWETGLVSSAQLAAHVAQRLGAVAEAEEVHRYMLELCGSLTFYPAINMALRRRRARGERQALVTVNPDIFAEIVSRYRLADAFDAMITSWEQGTVDKVELCRQALEQLGVASPAEAILIDNLEPNVTGWVELGGHGYLFRDDERFVTDVRRDRVPGFVVDDVAAGDGR